MYENCSGCGSFPLYHTANYFPPKFAEGLVKDIEDRVEFIKNTHIFRWPLFKHNFSDIQSRAARDAFVTFIISHTSLEKKGND